MSTRPTEGSTLTREPSEMLSVALAMAAARSGPLRPEEGVENACLVGKMVIDSRFGK